MSHTPGRLRRSRAIVFSRDEQNLTIRVFHTIDRRRGSGPSIVTSSIALSATGETRKCREAVWYNGYTSSSPIVVVITSAENVSISIGSATSSDVCARPLVSTALRADAFRFFVAAALCPAARRRRVVAAFLAMAFRRFVAAAFCPAARRRRVRAALVAAASDLPVLRAI